MRSQTPTPTPSPKPTPMPTSTSRRCRWLGFALQNKSHIKRTLRANGIGAASERMNRMDWMSSSAQKDAQLGRNESLREISFQPRSTNMDTDLPYIYTHVDRLDKAIEHRLKFVS